MLQIAICEDTKKDAVLLRRLVEEYLYENNFEGEVSVFESGEDLLSAFTPGAFPIIFMDIFMDGADGMETAKAIRALDENAAIIFLTVSKDHALEGYAVRAVHYLQKTITYPALSDAMDRCRALLAEHSRVIEVVSERATIKVLLRDILYIETAQRVRVIHTMTGEVKSSLTVEALDALTDNAGFIRCHRAFLINMRRIHRLLEKEIIMTDGTQIPVGRTYSEEFKREYTNFALSLARARNME